MNIMANRNIPFVGSEALGNFLNSVDLHNFISLSETKREIEFDRRYGNRLDYYQEQDPELFNYLRPNYKDANQRPDAKAAKALLKAEKLELVRDLIKSQSVFGF
jgi:hypothetical protein